MGRRLVHGKESDNSVSLFLPQRAVDIRNSSLKRGVSKVCSFSWRVTSTYLKRSDEKTLPVGFAGRVDTH